MEVPTKVPTQVPTAVGTEVPDQVPDQVVFKVKVKDKIKVKLIEEEEDARAKKIASLEAENRALRHSLELRGCEEMEHKPDPLEGVPFVSLSNAEIDAMTPEHPLYKLVRGDRKCKDE